MPNHVTTIITPSARMKEILERITSKNDNGIQYVDFERIIPIPKHIFQGDLGKEDEEKHGENNCWYKWKVFNWGTKWGAYECKFSNKRITFDTAWSSPLPIIREISMLFPDVTFSVKFKDESVDEWTEYTIKEREITLLSTPQLT